MRVTLTVCVWLLLAGAAQSQERLNFNPMRESVTAVSFNPFSDPATCTVCKGTGWDKGDPLRKDDQGPCDTCKGTGKVQPAKTTPAKTAPAKVTAYVNVAGSPDDVVAKTSGGESITRRQWDALSPPEPPFREDVARAKIVSGAEWSREVFDMRGTLVGTVWGNPPTITNRFGMPQGTFRPQMAASGCTNGRCGR